MDKEEIEKQELNEHVIALIKAIRKAKIGYNPSLFEQMLYETYCGNAYELIYNLLTTDPNNPQYGFTKLFERNRLDLSIETLVLYSKFSELFSEKIKNIAKSRMQKADPKFAWPDTKPKI